MTGVRGGYHYLIIFACVVPSWLHQCYKCVCNQVHRGARAHKMAAIVRIFIYVEQPQEKVELLFMSLEFYENR